MAVITAAGTKFSIGTTAATFASDTFTVVGEIVNIGEFGKEYQEITHQPVGSRATQKFKGSYNNGTITLQLGADLADAGQTALKTALDSDSDYNVRVELNNALTSGAGPHHGTQYDFKGKIMSYKVNAGGANNVVGATVVVAISGDITVTAAA